MKRYLTGRLLLLVPTFFGITLLVFLLMRAAPGSVADLMTDGGGMAARAQLLARLGLDRPVPLQYLTWLGGLLRGDLGSSYRTGQPVASMLLARAGPSLILTGSGVLLAIVLALPLGLRAAARPHGGFDKLSGALSLVSFGVPGFFLGLFAIYLFAVTLRALPGISTSGGGLILPVCVVALSSMGGLIRQTKTACLEVLGEEYIRAARAKGLHERVIMRRHVLRAALLPILTTLMAHIPHIIGGSMVVERVFGWPGMGSLLFWAVESRDYNVIMGQTVAVATTVLVTNLALDLCYRLIDPRVTWARK